MTHFDELSDFATKFGLFKFLVLNIGYSVYWLIILIDERADRYEKGFVFNIDYFYDKYKLNFVLSTILVWFCAPLIIMEFNIVSNFTMLSMGATGGLGISKSIQITRNFMRWRR